MESFREPAAAKPGRDFITRGGGGSTDCIFARHDKSSKSLGMLRSSSAERQSDGRLFNAERRFGSTRKFNGSRQVSEGGEWQRPAEVTLIRSSKLVLQDLLGNEAATLRNPGIACTQGMVSKSTPDEKVWSNFARSHYPRRFGHYYGDTEQQMHQIPPTNMHGRDDNYESSTLHEVSAAADPAALAGDGKLLQPAQRERSLSLPGLMTASWQTQFIKMARLPAAFNSFALKKSKGVDTQDRDFLNIRGVV